MAAYAAVVSLMNTIEQIQYNPRCPISLEKEHVESLRENINFLLDFLEGYNSHVADDLESRIADAAYAAEDVIESHIVDQILAESKRHSEEISSDEELRAGKEADGLDSRIADAAYAVEDVIKSHRVDQVVGGSTSHGEKNSSIDFFEGLQKVIEDMNSIKKEVMNFKENMGVYDQQLIKSTSISVGSVRSSSTRQNNTMVGFDDVLYEAMDKLVGGQPNRQIIPIVGMGGIGKTTLAKNIYQNKIVVRHFDILVWATISQEYKIKEILIELLQEGEENFRQMNEHELGDKLHKKLYWRRYLIIMDDIWDIEAWDQLKLFFPDNNNGSKIIFTTRLSNLASQVYDTCVIHMAFLDEDSSWKLFSKTVFEEEGCPPELEKIGKNIVKNCKGLPLSIVVIGGLLARSERTRKYWEYTLENLNSIVNLEDNEHGLQILYMSYNNLPVHLKPCFLYMGVFKEDDNICVSELIKLWLAEGFLRPFDDRSLKEAARVFTPHSSGKKRSLEKAAEEYLQELVDRNLILVEQRNYNGKVTFCKIHDLLRDLCLREAQKVKFFCVLREQSNIPQIINIERRICIHKPTQREKYPPEVLHVLSVARSFIWQHMGHDFPSFSSRLSRVYSWGYLTFNPIDKCIGEYIFQQVNLRYVTLRNSDYRGSHFSSNLLFPLWNLQTLILEGFFGEFILEIWKMPQLKYVKVNWVSLPDPPVDDIVILENLQALAEIADFKCGEEVVKRISNIKKLKVRYFSKSLDNHCINNLGHLNALESLHISFQYGTNHLLQHLTIPQNLRKLMLADYHDFSNSKDVLEKIGSLPHLEKLQLLGWSFKSQQWETVEGQFRSLKYLLLDSCNGLEYWTVESSHFPILMYLVLFDLKELKEIPSEIGEIPTLQSIRLSRCSNSAVDSAKKILEEQEALYGEVRLQLILDESEFTIDKDVEDDEDVDVDEDEEEKRQKLC